MYRRNLSQIINENLYAVKTNRLYESYLRQLLTEAKDPFEYLTYRFPNAPKDLVKAIIDIDPTKKKSYALWALTKANGDFSYLSSILGNGKLKKIFDYYKEHNQEVQLADCDSFDDAIRLCASDEDSVLSKSTEETTYVENLDDYVDSKLANDFDIVYNGPEWTIAVPNTYEASCKLGENMKWCTANAFGNGQYYYDEYLSNNGGKYYVNFDKRSSETRNGKTYPYTRYQFHFESKQFKDKEDNDVDWSQVALPQDVIDFYENEGYDTDKYMVDIETKRQQYYDDRGYYQITITDEESYELDNCDVYLNIAFDEDYELEEPDGDTDYFLFDDNDDRDAIDDTAFSSTTYNSVKICNECYRLTAKNGRPVILYFDKDSSNRYRKWNVINFQNIIQNDNGNFVIGYEDKNLTIIDATPNKLRTSGFSIENYELSGSITDVFFNTNIPGSVEIVTTKGHSLYYGDLVIQNDYPINDTAFELSGEDHNIVKGLVMNYRLSPSQMNSSNNSNETEQSLNNYRVDEKLNDHICILKLKNRESNESLSNYIVYDLVSKKITAELSNYDRIGNIFFSIPGDGTFSIIDQNGFISDDSVVDRGIKHNNKYSSFHFVKSDIWTVYDTISVEPLLQCNDVKKIGNGIIRTESNGSYKYFKTFDDTFAPTLDGYKSVQPISIGGDTSKRMLFATNDNNINTIITVPDLNIGATNVDKILSLDYDLGEEFVRYTTTDGKSNFFSYPTYHTLPENVDEIIRISYAASCIIYANNNRVFFYDAQKQQNCFFSNGITYDMIHSLSFNRNTIVIETSNGVQFDIDLVTNVAYFKYEQDWIRLTPNAPEKIKSEWENLTGMRLSESRKLTIRKKINEIHNMFERLGMRV